MLAADRRSPGSKGASGVHTSKDDGGTVRSAAANGGRFRSITMIGIFDIAAPLVTYYVLRSAGLTAVTALLVSGAFPAIGVTVRAISHRRLDVVGVLVLAGIVVGSVLGLVTANARLLLMEGSVPTAVFGVGCLGSLRARRPLMFAVALEFVGPDTAKGQEMTRLWHHEGYRRVFRSITAVWGVGFVVEAALRIIVVAATSTGTALAVSKVAPFVFGAVLSGWTVAYGASQKKKGERMAVVSGDATHAGAHSPTGEIVRATDQ